MKGQDLALLAAAGRLQDNARNGTDRRSQHEWAIAQLSLAESEGAFNSLQEIIAQGASDARVLSDAAAAALAQASSGAPEQLPVALDLATRAARLDPNLAEASFNRALILEKLSLTDEAIAEWRRYLTLERSPAWSREARDRLEELETQTGAQTVFNHAPCIRRVHARG